MAIKMRETLIHAIMWMNFENLMLSEESQTQGYMLYEPLYVKCPKQATL